MTYFFPSIPERIQWHEGMLLAPQHFQQSQARTDALAAWHMLTAAPLAWGVRHLEIDMGLLASGLLRVTALDAVLPDGTLVWHDASRADHGTLELDLAPVAGKLELAPQDIWLTLALSRSSRESGAPTRFASVAYGPVEDEVSEAVPAEVPRLRPGLGLATGAVPTSLWQHLLLGSVQKDNKQIRLGDELPPLLRLERDHPLCQRAWKLAAQLRSKAAYIARQTKVPSSRAEDRLASLEHREVLRCLLAGLAPLEAVLQTRPLHPHSLYMALCSLLGPLALLRAGAMPLLPPPYEHARPRAVFEQLMSHLEEAMAEVTQDHVLVLFEFKDGAFTLQLQPEWVTQRLVVGLRGQPEKDAIAWMQGAVIGSASSWNSLRERRVLGAVREPIDSVPELGVRSSNGYTLFAIEAAAPLVSAGQALLISNSNETLAAQRPPEAVLFVKG